MNSRSASGYAVYLEGAAILVKSEMQKKVVLSVTEAELKSGVSCDHDIMYALRVLKSLELQVELPMLLEIYNHGTVDLGNNSIVGGRTHNIETHQQYLCNLKEGGIW